MLPSATDAYNALQSYDNSRQSATDILNSANSQYGVDAANKQVSTIQGLVGNLQNAVNGVAPSVAGRTSGTFTTQGQRDALTNKEQAPILNNLGQQTQALGQAQGAQQQAQGMAQQMVGAMTAQDQMKYQSLLDTYNAANAAQQFQAQLDAQREQANAAQAFQQQQLAEQVREFNNPQVDNSLASELGGLFGGQSAGGGAQMQQRTGGGFNFQDANGNAISAASYAQLKNIPLRTLLTQMASSGDSGAKTALDFVGNDFGVNKAKLASASSGTSNLLNSLLWGVNSVSQPGATLAGNPHGTSGYA